MTLCRQLKLSATGNTDSAAIRGLLLSRYGSIPWPCRSSLSFLPSPSSGSCSRRSNPRRKFSRQDRHLSAQRCNGQILLTHGHSCRLDALFSTGFLSQLWVPCCRWLLRYFQRMHLRACDSGTVIAFSCSTSSLWFYHKKCWLCRCSL